MQEWDDAALAAAVRARQATVDQETRVGAYVRRKPPRGASGGGGGDAVEGAAVGALVPNMQPAMQRALAQRGVPLRVCALM